MNIGWRSNEYMDAFPAWSAEVAPINTMVTRDNGLIFNAHSLGLRTASAYLGLAQRTSEEGLTVFIHRGDGFSGVIPRPELCEPELGCLPFTTVSVNQYSDTAELFDTGRVRPIARLDEESTAIITKTLTELAMKKFPVQVTSR